MITTTGYSSTSILVRDMLPPPMPEREYKVRLYDEDGDRVFQLRTGGYGTINVKEDLYSGASDINQRLMPIIAKYNEDAVFPITRVEAYLEREENVAAVDLTIIEPTRTVTTQVGEWKPIS